MMAYSPPLSFVFLNVGAATRSTNGTVRTAPLSSNIASPKPNVVAAVQRPVGAPRMNVALDTNSFPPPFSGHGKAWRRVTRPAESICTAKADGDVMSRSSEPSVKTHSALAMAASGTVTLRTKVPLVE